MGDQYIPSEALLNRIRDPADSATEGSDIVRRLKENLAQVEKDRDRWVRLAGYWQRKVADREALDLCRPNPDTTR